MAYIITNTAMDFPDGAQRFNWCACENTKGPAGLGATPLFDFGFWNSYLTGGGAATMVPGVATGAPAAGAQASQDWAKFLLPAAAGGFVLWLFLKKGGGGRR